MLFLFFPEGVSIFYLCHPLSCSSKRAIDKKKMFTVYITHNPERPQRPPTPQNTQAHTNSAPKLLLCR